MPHIVKIKEIKPITHDTLSIKVEKPLNFKFVPGHSIMVSFSDNERNKRPFTFTSTNNDNYLEFIIKIYQGREFSDRVKTLKVGDNLLLNEMFGSYRYIKPSLFVAAGSGITPFLSILRTLKEENKLGGNTLIYINKKEEDVICKEELQSLLKNEIYLLLTRESTGKISQGKINDIFINNNKIDFDRSLLVCGAWQFMQEIKGIIKNLQDTKT